MNKSGERKLRWPVTEDVKIVTGWFCLGEGGGEEGLARRVDGE